nr:hybrid pks-nrps synthetase tas1 [Quercus suber]
MGNMRARFQTMVGLSKVEHVKLDRMLEWLPQYPSLPPSPTAVQSNPHRHIHHFFDAHAQSNPTSLALYSKELQQAITYGDLYASTERQARALLSRGITRESVVVLRLRSRVAMVGWILAVLKTGAAFVYVDPDVPEAQMSLVSSNCKPSLVVDDFAAQDLTQSQLQHSSGSDKSNDLDGKKYGTDDKDLAYIIYTSGSAGEPKGVMVEHGNVAAFVQAAAKVFECGFGSRVLQLASFTFDASVLEWCTALCTGGTLCFSQYPKQLVGEYLADVLEENEINFLEITPSALASLPTDREYPALRQISMGGEAPSHQIFAEWHSRVNLVNTYGPTEAAVAVCFNAIDKSADLPQELSCGPPSAGVSIYVCSEDSSTILRPGCPGEVCLAGSQVARGYRGKPEITARNFTVLNGVRVYRTGDRGKILEDGSLLILGRIDRELKIRGYRIAPEEVEKAIMDVGCGSQDVSVQASEDGLELVAYIAPDNVDAQQLLAKLKEILPSYKIPSNVILARALPKSIAGKVNHKEVRLTRDQFESSQTQLASSQAPLPSQTTEEPLPHNQNSEDHEDVSTSDVEDLIAQIWQEVLNISSAPPSHLNFFDIGGHSLMVPKLLQKLKDTFSLPKLRLVELFHQSTIRQQVALCAGTKAKSVVRKSPKGHEHAPQTVGKPSLPTLYNSMPSTQVVTPASSTVSLQDIQCHDVPISIVGIAGRFPGAKTADQFYDNLAKGYNGITKSQNVKEVLPGNLWVPKAGILQDIEDFDHEFWKLSVEDATDMDPQQRLFLDVAYEALTDAGLSIDTMDGRRTGLFVGSANHAYHLHTESVLTDSFLRENRGFVAPSISARTAYHLDISGPNVTVQTNCASSTVALSLACDAIRLGRCDVAVRSNGYVTGNGQIFSPRGECNPFDSRADGTVPADAVTAIVLKRSTEARVDKTPTYANILGTACGSDGASEKAGFQVPSPRGIAEVIKSAWTSVTPEKLKYADGTPIGDALELEGLSLGIKEAGGAAVPFTVGSTKGNMGNAQHASGLVSLIKLCKSMQKGVVPATRGCVNLNAMVNQDLPLVFARQDTHLKRDDILAVSASGWGGVNSHVVMGFPDARLQKTSTVFVPKGKFHRQTLAAPRRGKYIERSVKA